jgi:hypothetical protein
MDPYLEYWWRDVHTRMMVYAVDAIQKQLPAELWAQVEQGVSIDIGDDLRAAGPDVRVMEDSTGPFQSDEGDGATAVATVSTVTAAKAVIVPVTKSHTERHIQIVDTKSGNRVVTAVELLSPTNKISGSGRDAYQRKQRDYLAGGVNLVEIDLVREGRFVLAVPEHELAAPWRTPYMVCVRRATRPEEAAIYPIPLRERLPAIQIPLRPSDPDVVLDLQPLVDQVYANGPYSRVDYTRDPEPPFGPVDARWVDELLQAAGRRARSNGAEGSEGS